MVAKLVDVQGRQPLTAATTTSMMLPERLALFTTSLLEGWKVDSSRTRSRTKVEQKNGTESEQRQRTKTPRTLQNASVAFIAERNNQGNGEVIGKQLRSNGEATGKEQMRNKKSEQTAQG